MEILTQRPSAASRNQKKTDRINRIKNGFTKENSPFHPVHPVHPVKTLFPRSQPLPEKILSEMPDSDGL
jgi:hypothetical protein